MSEHSREEVARRAGVDTSYVDRLVELGILKPDSGDLFSSGDVRRARWIQSLERAGVPLGDMAAAVGRGALSFSFLDMSAFDRFAGLAGVTFQEVSQAKGVPLELLMVVREAFGLSEPRAHDYLREAELSVISAVEFQVTQGFRPIAIERWLRVYAESLRRIAETETDWYRTEVVVPLFEAGMTEAEMLDAQGELGSRMAPLLEQALLAIYRGQQEYVWTRSAVENIEDALEAAGLYERLHRPPAVSFLDLSGYTRLTEERGDEAAADLASKLRVLVRQSSREHGGESVKWLGDGVMSYFPDPGNGVLAALDMVERAANDALPPARVGIHAGPVVFQEGDYFGRTVNVAARISDYARAGEVLVSQEVVEAASGGPLSFVDIGPVALKGVVGALRLYTAHRARPPEPELS
ncbi:MAG TPA: adenylate/guanylate cyclase domain-containing protein [Acidimicrobiia bacterium]|nr:adenylate/guanylate cyclase domain-containing protein [Acidimicrobiia bacterium]